MSVKLSPEQAETLIRHVEQTRDGAVTKLKQAQEAQENMLSQNWQGDAANKYRSASQDSHDDFDTAIKELNQAVETGSAHIREVANADQG